MYKYSLESGAKKYYCPQCNKKTLVRYKDNENGSYIGESFGRCDRESKCQYHKRPSGGNSIITPSYTLPTIQPSCHNINVLSYYGKNFNHNNLISFLKLYFSVQDIEVAIKKYFIGTSSHWNGATIFWQVDHEINVCGGKVMLYSKTTGKRVKKPFSHINWMHKVMRIHTFVLQQCLFGVHNLCDYDTQSVVCIVESEKTAVIMSIMYPSYLWLATGSKSNFKQELLQPLIEYKIIAFPDKTEFPNWNTKVENLIREGFNISCSNLLEEKDMDDGDDLIDFIIEQKVA